MDTPSGFRQHGQRRPGRGGRGGATSRPQLFQDTSNSQTPPGSQAYGLNSYGQPQHYGFDSSSPGYPPPQQQQVAAGYPGQRLFQDPMANMAVQYGTTLADQGKEYVHKNLEKYVATSKLKYYFVVDTAYVGKKLGLLIFPYTHTNWSIQYNQDDPIAPRYEINAPDLYIPAMAFVTYILVTGVVMGTQNRFTPEQIGVQASTALVWVIIELIAIMFTLYVMNLNSDLKYTDCLAYSGYKFVGMIFCLVAGLLFRGLGYYLILLWCGAALAFFLIRTLRQKVLPHAASDGYARGTKRSLYLILSIACVQPVLMWWLTAHIMFPRIP